MPPQAPLPCLNCQAPVPPGDSRLFAGVFVCVPCFMMAERLQDRCLLELVRLQKMLQESIRLALIEGRLQVGRDPPEEVSKREVFRSIAQLLEGRAKSV